MQVILDWIQHNYLELIASIAGIIGVWLTTKQIIWCWPVALVNVLLYIYVFYSAKLYADFGLQIFYLIMTIYGWLNWLYGGTTNDKLKVSRITIKSGIFLFCIGILSLFILGYFLKKYTDASLPYWDATTSVFGMIGTYLMAKKVLEHWIIWIVIDTLCVGIYFYKELFATSALYFIFIILAIYGLNLWKKDHKSLQIVN